MKKKKNVTTRTHIRLPTPYVIHFINRIIAEASNWRENYKSNKMSYNQLYTLIVTIILHHYTG